MYLYELALELDVRSPELVERAAALGLAGLGPSSQLSPAQVASLRGGVPVPPPATDGSGAVPGAAPATGSGRPVSWAPVPTGTPAAPTAEPASAPVRSSLPPPPGRQAGPGSGVGDEDGGGAICPTSPPSLASPLPVTPASPSGPALPGPAEQRGRGRRPVLVAAAVIGILVVSVIAIAMVGGNGTRERRAELEARNAAMVEQTEAEAGLDARLVALDERWQELRAAGPAPVPTAEELAVICAVRPELKAWVVTLEADELAPDWDAARAAIVGARPGWAAALDDLIGAHHGAGRAGLELYRARHEQLLDELEAAASTEDIQQVLAEASLAREEPSSTLFFGSLISAC